MTVETITRGWTLVRHRNAPLVRFWVRGGPDGYPLTGPVPDDRTPVGLAPVEIRASRNAAFDDHDRPPERCQPSGTVPVWPLADLYETCEPEYGEDDL